jgi:hypothetical protein
VDELRFDDGNARDALAQEMRRSADPGVTAADHQNV